MERTQVRKKRQSEVIEEEIAPFNFSVSFKNYRR